MNGVNYRPLTPTTFLERTARVFPDHTAVIDGEIRLNYREFFERACRLAATLQRLNIAPGDRVAFLALNGEPLLTAHYGVPMSGAVLVAMNTRLARHEILHILRETEAAVLFVDPSLVPNALELRAGCPALRTVVELSNEDRIRHGPEAQNSVSVSQSACLNSEDDLLSLNYTSGTTGYLKGVMYTHRGAYLNALGNAIEVGLDGETRYLWTLPMFHCHGWCYTWAVTAVGGTHICIPRPAAAEVFRVILNERVTHLCAAPTVLIDLAQYAASNQIRLSSPLTIMTGGAAPTPQVIHDIEGIGATVIHLYGLTETYGPSTICQWRSKWDAETVQQRAVLKARQGVADLMVEQRVVRTDMTDVKADGEEIGELVIRGNAVMKGYYRDPDATAKAFAGGWFHTGDLAVLHADGYAEIKDRAKHIIISGGEKISTLEVEREISTHPAVLEVAVVPSPHERWGEVPTAFVVLKPLAQVTSEELYNHCRARLAAFKCPRRIEFIKELPKTSTGKVQKHVLKEMESKGADSGTV